MLLLDEVRDIEERDIEKEKKNKIWGWEEGEETVDRRDYSNFNRTT